MKGTMIYGPRDIRFEDRPGPRILQPKDVIICLSATCICGSDLWPYRGIAEVAKPTPMGHEYCGIVVSMLGRRLRPRLHHVPSHIFPALNPFLRTATASGVN